VWNNPLRRKLRNQASSNSGEQAERQAEAFLLKQGLTLRERNYRCSGGEIDLIMVDADQLVFVEVRFRKQSAYGSPLESVGAQKQQKLHTAAQHYLQHHKLSEKVSCRFDVVGLSPNNQCNWIQNAF